MRLNIDDDDHDDVSDVDDDVVVQYDYEDEH